MKQTFQIIENGQPRIAEFEASAPVVIDQGTKSAPKPLTRYQVFEIAFWTALAVAVVVIVVLGATP